MIIVLVALFILLIYVGVFVLFVYIGYQGMNFLIRYFSNKNQLIENKLKRQRNQK